jgi:hypothetical protein
VAANSLYLLALAYPERDRIHREKDDQTRIRAPLILDQKPNEISQHITCCHQGQEPKDKNHLISLSQSCPDSSPAYSARLDVDGAENLYSSSRSLKSLGVLS